jgi:hypothetical protein
LQSERRKQKQPAELKLLRSVCFKILLRSSKKKGGGCGKAAKNRIFRKKDYLFLSCPEMG